MDIILDEITPEPIPKPRQWWLALLLSILTLGLGQIYNGQLRKGLLYFVGILFVVPIFLGLTRCITSFYGMAFGVAVMYGGRFWLIIDALRWAKKQPNYILKTYNQWYVFLPITIVLNAITWFYNASILMEIQVHKIPNTNNAPTIQRGDYVVLDIKAYSNAKVNYGDIIMFENEDWGRKNLRTFRVIGLPNDRIDIIKNVVSINGQPNEETFIREVDEDGFPLLEIEEKLPNGRLHRIYKDKNIVNYSASNRSNIIVPENSYFVWGDNRDEIQWLGFVPKEKIKGRIVYSYWGKTWERMGVSF